MKRKYRSRPWKKSRRGRYSRRPRKSFKTRVNQVLNRKTETKYFDIGVENQQLWHNTGFGVGIPPFPVASINQFFNPWVLIPPGTGRAQRIGDKITPRGMKLNLWLANKRDRPNLMYRIIVCTLPKVFNGNVVGTQFDPFQIPNTGALGNNMLYPLDKDKGVKAFYDKVIRVQDNIAFADAAHTREIHTYKKLWIKRKRSRDILFDTTSTTIVNRPLAVYIIPYDSFGTLTTDNIASMAGFMRLYYKDI